MRNIHRTTSSLAFLFFLQTAGDPTWAYREYFTPDQKERLGQTQTVLVEVVALTDQGPIQSTPIRDTVARRLEELGYGVVTDRGQPHDVLFRVKCEQRKMWEGTSSMGSDADLPDSPSRVWTGPACQLNYFVNGTKIKWQKEVRTDFEDAEEAARRLNISPGDYAVAELREKLEQYDFPVLVAAEWGHGGTLLKLLGDTRTNQRRRLRITSLLGEMMTDEALPAHKPA